MKRAALSLAGVVLLSACSEMAGPPGSIPTTPMSLAIATRPTTSAGAADPSESFTDPGGNTLVIDSAIVVVRKLRLVGGPMSACASDDFDGQGDDDSLEVRDSAEGHDSVDADHDSTGMDRDSMGDTHDTGGMIAPMLDDDDGGRGCGVLRLGPFLVSLPLTGGAAQQFTVTVDSGTYASAMFEIHRPSTFGDSAFVAANPAYRGVSIRLVGSWNGAPFVFTTGVSGAERADFDPPLVVGAAPVTFTLMVDLSGWFRSGSGALIDPLSALDDSTNAPIVRANIERSFHALRDDDHDGRDDRTEHHDD